MKKEYNQKCEICNSCSWTEIYYGDIRDGSFGFLKSDAAILECTQCGVHRLSEGDCIPEEYYSSGEYRNTLMQSLDAEEELHLFGKENREVLNFILSLPLIGQNVLEVGSGTGALLNVLSGVASNLVGVEPCSPYLESIQSRGHIAYSSLEVLTEQCDVRFDYGLSVQVIEHALNPVLFLKQIYGVLKPGATLLVTTPNREDILMHALPETFKSFFYRAAHRWYFDKNSLELCARSAGYEVVETIFSHSYGLSNFLYWLQENKPRGYKKMIGVNKLLDDVWSNNLEDIGKSNNISLLLRVPE